MTSNEMKAIDRFMCNEIIRAENPYTLREFYEFASYVLSFYNSKDGLYPFNCSNDVIIELCQTVMIHKVSFEGDSFDRENVRTMLEAFGYTVNVELMLKSV